MRPFSIRVLLLTACLVAQCVLGASCQPRKSSPAHIPDPNDPNVAAIVQLITQMPRWPINKGGDPNVEQSPKSRIEYSVFSISRYDLGDIRDALQMYIALSESPDNDILDKQHKIFIVNRYIFDVPEIVRRDSPHWAFVFTGDDGMPRTMRVRNEPQPDDTINALWPWSKDASGRLHLTGVGRGYTGAVTPSLRLKEFDYYRKTFGRRPNILPPSEPNE